MTHTEHNCGCGGTGAWALWLDRNTIAWPKQEVPKEAQFGLQGHPEVTLKQCPLTPTQCALDLRIEPKQYLGLRLEQDGCPLSREQVCALLRGPLRVEVRSKGRLTQLSGIQVAGVLDDLYAGAAHRKLGLHWDSGKPTLALWAPTAAEVSLQLWTVGGAQELPATRDEDGVWVVRGDSDWEDAEYRWQVRVYVPSLGSMITNSVTDPYSVGLTVDSRRSVIVNREESRWKPEDWGKRVLSPLVNPASQSIYELHVRDFSAWDLTVPVELRGTYSAFSLECTAGVSALKQLSEAGLTTVHLLPTFDISSASIPESRAEQKVPEVAGIPLLPENEGELSNVSGWGPATELAQSAVEEVASEDAFNWGYDPQHWLTPEGSYARAGYQVGGARTREYRDMVQALHDLGLRVVQDVVFNHTFAWGQESTSVLDKVVPGYYHRLDKRGRVETSTCCSNVATEHLMAEKLMVDALVDAAVHYHVDGFRFDLMGHHSLDNLRAVRKALDALTPEVEGVSGVDLYLYGEGWDFGEVAGDRLFVQASLRNIAGTGIGVFNDRLRDAVRGGSPADPDPGINPGFATRDYFGSERTGLAKPEVEEIYRQMDLVKLSLVGGLRGFELQQASGKGIVDTATLSAAFAAEPQECVNYVEAHDDQTLFDTALWKLPVETEMEERIRVQVLANATVALGQGVAFWASGTELLRSKSLDRDSYNSGDWFNAIDWSGTWNHFGRGLPSAARNRDAWKAMKPLLRRTNLRPQAFDMRKCREESLLLLRMRSSSPLFTLGSSAEIRERISFLATGVNKSDSPGVIAMWIDATGRQNDLPSEPLTIQSIEPEKHPNPVVELTIEHSLPQLSGPGLLIVFNASSRAWSGRPGTTLEGCTAPGRSVRVKSVLGDPLSEELG